MFSRCIEITGNNYIFLAEPSKIYTTTCGFITEIVVAGLSNLVY